MSERGEHLEQPQPYSIAYQQWLDQGGLENTEELKSNEPESQYPLRKVKSVTTKDEYL